MKMKIKLPTSIVQLDLLFDEDDNYYESTVVVVIEGLNCEI